jgi:hypothetical protein
VPAAAAAVVALAKEQHEAAAPVGPTAAEAVINLHGPLSVPNRECGDKKRRKAANLSRKKRV